MATAQLDTLMRHLKGLAAGRQRTDRQLLEDFASRRDESAFTALLSRHGPMVLRVCRHVLHHEQDAEDAFQAAFLVLARHAASVRRRDTLAGWLCGVAYRTAMDAKRKAARRRTHEAKLRGRTPSAAPSPTWDDVQAVLDEEVQRLPGSLRSAFVLCVLDGKTVPAAAAELGAKEGTVSWRLARARQQLRQRLTRRGIELTAVLAALSVARAAGRAAVPAALARATIGFGLSVAAGEPAAAIPSHVAALAAGVTRAMFLTRARSVLIASLAVGLFALGAGLFARQALAAREAPPEAPPPAEAAKDETRDAVGVAGRVLDPDGKPVAGAKLYLNHAGPKEKQRPVRATTGADGRFTFTFQRPAPSSSAFGGPWFQVIAVADGFGPDWAYEDKPQPRGELTLRLVKDVPIQGRVLDLDGRPVKGATLRVEHIDAYADTEAFLQTVRERASPTMDSKGWGGPFPGQPATLTTDADGRFRLTGVGQDRVVQFQLEGPGIQYGPVRVLARALKAPVEPRLAKFADGPAISKVYGATFEHAAQPSRPIRGVVRDKKTGKPVAGVEVRAQGTTRQTHTDKEGRYELLGCPKSSEGYRVIFSPVGQLYFGAGVTFPDTPGIDTVAADFDLVSGIVAKGHVTHSLTGKPIAGARVYYNPLYPNPAVRVFGPGGAGMIPCSWAETGPDGSYSLVVLPGPGALGFMASAPNEVFMPARVTAQDLKELFKDDVFHGNESMLKVQASEASWSAMAPSQCNAVLLISPEEKDETIARDVALRPAPPLRGRVVGPDGKPLTGVTAYNLAPGVLSQPLADQTFTVEGLNPRLTRQLVFLDRDRKHGAFVSLTGEVKEPLTVKLEACGSVVGRILDQDGLPAAEKVVRLDTDAAPDSATAKVKTDRDGRFRIDGLVPGQTYQARFGLPPFGAYLFASFKVKAGESKDLGEFRLKP
jgi:RNA polymerase sigma factor (sigma-70 family)